MEHTHPLSADVADGHYLLVQRTGHRWDVVPSHTYTPPSLFWNMGSTGGTTSVGVGVGYMPLDLREEEGSSQACGCLNLGREETTERLSGSSSSNPTTGRFELPPITPLPGAHTQAYLVSLP